MLYSVERFQIFDCRFAIYEALNACQIANLKSKIANLLTSSISQRREFVPPAPIRESKFGTD
ncbi:MAG: hypothetical protein AUJ04_10445 [Acidobacteria bacterium 13_1_40CM_3_55_6]|nr:MAG: hypothetical protein AUJ04_10445 [Acidobacteria bacterium 13_1_40CM_3_55_6]